MPLLAGMQQRNRLFSCTRTSQVCLAAKVLTPQHEPLFADAKRWISRS
jgi:hypothetical protein